MRTSLLLVVLVSAFAACVPHRDLPPAEIEKLTSLKEVMDVQATVADPEWKKIGDESFTEADFAAVADVGARIQVTSQKAHQFSKGPEFDALANQLHEHAVKLSSAAAARNAKDASTELGAMKATCKECHSKFK